MLKEEMPNYRIQETGVKSATDLQIIASILGGDEKALNAARKIYARCGGNLYEISCLKISDIQQYKGIGIQKATAFVAAMEFYRRAKHSDKIVRDTVRSSQDAYNIMSPLLMDLEHEEFYCLVLNQANKVIGKIKVSEGGLAMTVVCKKKLFSQVFRGYPKAKALILAHNHPSGNLSPSRADLDITKELVDAGKILSLNVLDHIIIGGTRYTSFADEGYL